MTTRENHCHLLVGCSVMLVLGFLVYPAAGEETKTNSDWPVYGADKANTKYVPLDQIHADNVASLEVVWRWESPDNLLIDQNKAPGVHIYESTPLKIGPWLYVTTSLSQVACLDAETGKTRWVFNPESYVGRLVHLGLAYWSDTTGKGRIVYGTSDGRLFALAAETGQRIDEFGRHGKIDLREGLRLPAKLGEYGVCSPPIICRNVVLVGATIPDANRTRGSSGDIRGFDVRTGRELWAFHSIPQEGEVGNSTWAGDSWKYTGNVNIWSIMSADEELGYFYLPFDTPGNGFYGGERHGGNLFGETLVCLDAKTGKRVWHYQICHHGLWDYDIPPPPLLCDIVVQGMPRKAVAQATKQGFCFIFDRVSGEPIWPIEERRVPQSSLQGESSSPTQPFPTWPLPYERQGLTNGDLIDFTPELRQRAVELIKTYRSGPMYTPVAHQPTIFLPGWFGGTNWEGTAFDPESNIWYVPSITSPIAGKLDDHQQFHILPTPNGPQGYPLLKPPYGRITAINLNTGEHLWLCPTVVES